MSGPFVYTPLAFEPTPLLGYGPYMQRSPFIPPAALFPSSPYPPSSPYLRPTTPVGAPFNNPYWSPPPRARRPSWHGGLPPSPFLAAPSSTNIRRRSFGGGFRPWEPASPWAGTSSYFQIHPLLNGETPSVEFNFDLASPSFSPFFWVGPGQTAMISADELRESATYPPLTRMRITHDAIKEWPIDLEFHDDGYTDPTAHPPITLGDVLYLIHSSLHRQVTHEDWARLSVSKETEIARAYTRRYRSVPSSAQVEASRGVKRVDYLLDKHIFRGLIRSHDEDGFYRWKLITA
ncbi:hypothetical protein EV363DRAFT_1354028 [Boletus edulis]|uniref:DUF6699 domain-containing protein n=1 Tax=Boletus edulis BED1 TaxID=1328754 RepID=A0AAD4BIB6_BOLED|nr:hypothetical protein EV363DRAFT_1354028 [Boletus edulis]KAF8431103.1 hypothetical protein L210DRAFT_3006802 [Boletus edulis BED1]